MTADDDKKLETGVRAEVTKLFDETPCMPIIVRLAWHDSGTYNVEDKSGGANGTVRFSPEADHGANNGLGIARDLLEPIKKEFPAISYADLYQLASVVAIEYAGGPKIPFRMGRVDGLATACTPDGRLPDADKRMPHLRDIFYRMGLSDQDIVVLSAAHTLGRGHTDRSGSDGPWTKEPLTFDNSYFTELLKPAGEADPKLLRMASDLCLLDEGKGRHLCEKYAKSQDAFFADYVVSHQKLSELGCFQ